MKKILIGGTNSGCGKTTITIGIIKALIDRGYKVSSFKCGPDYIDPMFHSKIIGASGRNLDSVFCDEETIGYLIKKYSEDFVVIEGVMGYYDGVLKKGSSAEIALKTNTLSIIIIDCKGMSSSIGAVIKGFLTYDKNNIAGFIFNRLPESLIESVKIECERLGTKYLGRFPVDKRVTIGSRHLGLLGADEISDLKEKVRLIGEICNQNILMDEIVKLSENDLLKNDLFEKKKSNNESSDTKNNKDSLKKITQFEIKRDRFLIEKRNCIKPKIALARDEAFTFIYPDNVDFLKELGCEIVEFSPINDECVPKGISGLILPGGYPELHAKRLADNKSMLKSIKECIGKVPAIAECGGFMYLHDSIKFDNGEKYKMVGAIEGEVIKKDKLVRFGYVNMQAKKDSLFGNKNIEIKAHEFHYWDSTNNGKAFNVTKISNGIQYEEAYLSDNFYGGFPHIYFYGNIDAIISFVDKCYEYSYEIHNKR